MDLATGAQKASSVENDASRPGPQVATGSNYVSQMAAIPQLAAFGAPFKSSSPIMLTESETEYVVSCIKHVFPNHLVFQV